MLALFPISDANPTRRFPFVTIGLIVTNIIAFLREPLWEVAEKAGQLNPLDLYFFTNAPVPCQLTEQCLAELPIPDRGFGSFMVAVIVSTFLHANLLHIAGNMLFLWVFGNNVEDYLGPIKYVVFYLLGGTVAAMAHVAWSLKDIPCTQADFGACVPAVGASGAVAAVMGAYIVLFPRARVNVLVPIVIIFTVIQMSALAVLGIWFAYQFVIGAQELAGPSGVAWMAHVGGFVYGAVIIFLLGGRPHRPPRVIYQPQWE